MKQKIATIFGASGFIGRHLIRRLTEKNYRIIAVTRSPYKNGYLKPLGNPGQIDLEKVNIFDENSLKDLLKVSDIVINLVGILYETRKQKFNDIHYKFPDMLSRICSETNIQKLIHVSALGVKENSTSKYIQTKFDGEKAVLKNFKNSIILRPSIVFGPEDNFFNRFASLAEFLPFLPLIGGGKSNFQPIYVGDVARAIVSVLKKEEIKNNIYELGGPEIFSFKNLIEILLKQIKKKRILISIPFKFAKFQAKIFQLFPNPLLTEDQVELLKQDNVVTGKYPNLKNLEIEATNLDSILPDYLYRFRKGGQFSKN